MKTKGAVVSALLLLFTCFSGTLSAQDNRAQYPGILRNSYFSVNLGYLHTPFSNDLLEAGFKAESVEVPPIAPRIVLFGHHFNRYFSAQVSYLRPVKYTRYNNINGDKQTHTAWMHYGTLTAKGDLPLGNKFSVYAEGGLAITNRSGFEINNVPAVQDANYGSMVGGTGVEYHLNNRWDLMAGMVYLPGKDEVKQPHTIYYSAGFRLNMRERSAEKLEEARVAGYSFKKTLIQLGYATNAFGYGINNFLSKTVPIFWGGGVEIEKGVILHYQRNIYHTTKVFALNLGAGVSYWKTKKNGDEFFTLSAFPVFQFNVIRTKPLDVYLFYSVAGPSYISEDILDDLDTGNGFTFQDYMGLGFFAGRKKNLNFELNINHYSNGNIFPENAGVKIPTTFNIGYAF
jgi:opacity protein-like surface antigen